MSDDLWNDDCWWHQQDLEMQQYEEHQKLIALFFILLSMEVSHETI
jgi:hypothetical protein